MNQPPPSGRIPNTASAPPKEWTDSSELDNKSESCVILKSPSETVPKVSAPANEANDSLETEVKFAEEETQDRGMVCSIVERRVSEPSLATSDSNSKELEFEMKVLNVNVQRTQGIEMNVFKSYRN